MRAPPPSLCASQPAAAAPLCPAGFKRLKMKLSLNVPLSDLLHVLKSDRDLPWLARLVDPGA